MLVRTGIGALVLGAGVAGAADPQPEIRTDNQGQQAIAIVDDRVDEGDGKEKAGGPRTQGASWSALGPFGGDVQDVNASPTASDVVLAGIAPAGGTGGTLFRSTDGGETWNEVSDLSDTSVYDVEFDPSGTAYIGTFDGVWVSDDDGGSWTALDLGIGVNNQVFDVAIDPNDPDTLWAGVADAIGNQATNLVRSDDAGASWTDVTPPLAEPIGGRAIAINPSDSDNVVAGFGGGLGGGAVWVSDDGGSSWTDRTAGLPGNPINAAVHTGSRILVGGGQAFGSQLVGLYGSTDNGATWNQLHTAAWPSEIVGGIAVDPADADTVLAATASGAHRSTDGGSSWTTELSGTESLSLNSVRFASGSSSDLFVGATSIGVLASDDGGDQFETSSFGIGALNVVDAKANPNDPDEIALAYQSLNSGGVQTSTDGGQTWSLEDTPGTRWNTVGWDTNGTLYAISDGPTGSADEGLYRRESDDSWTSLGPDQGDLFESELFAIYISENDPDLIFLGGGDFGVAGSEHTVWRSDDGGGTWTKAFEGVEPDDNFKTVLDIEFVPDGTDTVGVAAFDDTSQPQEGGALRTTDGGMTWSESSSGLPAGVQGVGLAPSPGNPQTFFFADGDFGAGGVHMTTDAGQSWSSTGFAGRVLDIAADPSDDQVLYIMQFNDPKVSRSEDQGATFSAFDDGLDLAGSPSALSFGSASSPRLLLSTDTGVFARDLEAPCPADINGDGELTSADFLAYIDAFAAGDAVADFDGDGTIDSADFLAYIDAFAAGCP